MENKMTVRFSAIGVNEAFARSAAASFVAVMDPTLEELTEIKTGVSEAVSNCIIHGYKEDPAGIVELECVINMADTGRENAGGINGVRKVTIIVRDRGVGIDDVEKAREPMFTTGKPEERSGMGFTVMESFMDRVDVESEAGEGTTVTMIKLLDACGQ